MTNQEFYTIAGYLANPVRRTLIEMEVPAHAQAKFEGRYHIATGGSPLPVAGTPPYYLFPPGTNKWSLEARLYFQSNNNLPMPLFDELEPRKFQNRHGYENWDRRLSKAKPVFKLFETGFVIGQAQNIARIRALVPIAFLADFDYGFAL